MTDTPHPEDNPFDVRASIARYFTEQQEYQQRAETLRPANKTVLFDALAAAGITQVVVTFDGYGDSGQVESIDAKAGDEDAALPSGMISLIFARWGQADATAQDMTIADAVEHLAYDFLSQTHGGWENNDGAFGDFTFDVAERSITLDYNERYTATESYSHEF